MANSIESHGHVQLVDDTIDTDSYDYHIAASTANEKTTIAEMEAKWKDVPDKYFITIAHFLAGHINDTDAMDQFNGPILKSSIKSVYWIFLIQYAALAISGILMNVGIIAYVMYYRLYKDVTHAFIVNLALCHFVQCAIVLPITLMVMLIQNWIFGQFLCFFLPMLQDIPLHVALISHLLIAWDRMRWLSNPLKSRLPAFVCCCATWLTGMVIALPYPIYTIYVEIGDYVPLLDGIGLCVVNLMDDMHEYMRGLFFIMYCGPAVLLAYLYIRTSQELRPPDGPYAIMMFEHRADIRNRQRNSSASSVDRTNSGGTNSHTAATTTTATTNMTTHTNGGHSTSGALSTGSTATMGATGTTTTTAAGTTAGTAHSYDLYSAELDVYREKRKQRNFGSMAATQIVCLCPLMVLRFARLSMEETYENQKHFDFTYLMFVWAAFLPTVIIPCIFGSQIIPRTEQERLRGYFRLSSKHLHKQRCANGLRERSSQSSREDSIEKDENTNTTQATSIIANGDGIVLNGEASGRTSNKHSHHSNCNGPPPYKYAAKDRKTGTKADGGGGAINSARQADKNVRIKKNDVKINIIAESQQHKNYGIKSRQPMKNANYSSTSSSSNNVQHGSQVSPMQNTQRKLTLESVDNNSFSNLTSSTYCIGNNSSINDDIESSVSNFGDGEDSSIVSGMIVHGSGGGGVAGGYYEKKWSLSGPSSSSALRQRDMSFSDCGSFSRMDSSSTLERDLEMMDLLERERSMDLQEIMELDKRGEMVRLPSERRKLPDIEKILQRSPKIKIDPYSYDISTTATMASSASTKDTTQTTLSTPVPPGCDPLQCSNINYNNAAAPPSKLNADAASATASQKLLQSPTNPTNSDRRRGDDDDDDVGDDDDEEVPQDFFDNYTPGGCTTAPPIASNNYQYQYTRRLSRKSSHHSQGSTGSHRSTSKRDSFNSLNGSDLIAGAFGELDPTQPLTKMSVIESRMRRSGGGCGGGGGVGGGGGSGGGRTSSFSTSSGRSSMKSRDYGHGGSNHSTHPDLDFRENIFAEL